MNNNLHCGYGSGAGCLALLNATSGGPAEGRIQQGEVSACPLVPVRWRCFASGWVLQGRRGYSILKGSYPYLSSIKYPVSRILPIVV